MTATTAGRTAWARRGAVSGALLFLAAVLSSMPVLAAAVPSKAKVHGISISGRVSKVNSAAKTFAVLDGSGHDVVLTWTAATRVTGGEIKPGEVVTVRYLDKDQKHIATTVHVGPVAASKPPAAKDPTAAPASVPAVSPSPATH